MPTSIQSIDANNTSVQVNGQEAIRFVPGGVQIPQINGGQLAGLRNRIINGKMEIAQRATTFAGFGTGATYTLDRWVHEANTSSFVTWTQSTDVPTAEFQTSLRATVTTASATVAAGNYVMMDQHIEGYNVSDLIGKTFTISFWVKSPKTGIHCIALRNSGFDRNYVLEYTVNLANTWEYKSLTVTGGLITAGTWNWGNGAGLRVHWILACGSTFVTATKNTWVTGTILSTAGQVNVVDTVGNVFAITGVQLEVGSVATAYEHRLYSLELGLCQRYYELGLASCLTSSSSAGWYAYTRITYKQTKRVIPTFSVMTILVNSNSSSPTQYSANTDSTGYYVTTTASGPAEYQFNWACTAEI